MNIGFWLLDPLLLLSRDEQLCLSHYDGVWGYLQHEMIGWLLCDCCLDAEHSRLLIQGGRGSSGTRESEQGLHSPRFGS